MVSGLGKNGKCRSRVMMTAYIVDSSGKRLYRDEILTYSSDRIEVKGGLYSDDELMDLFREAIGVACYRFIWKFAGTQSGSQTRPR
jgi:hypothetical protein